MPTRYGSRHADSAKGNKGPQGFANVRDGKYDTNSPDGKGIAGGPTVIRLTGFSAPGGKLICEYEYQVDLPAQNGTLKVEAPGKGNAKQPANTEI